MKTKKEVKGNLVQTTRTLKVDQTSQDREGLYHSFPRIKLQGQWLAKAGFTPEMKVAVHVTQNRIEITPIQRKEIIYNESFS